MKAGSEGRRERERGTERDSESEGGRRGEDEGGRSSNIE